MRGDRNLSGHLLRGGLDAGFDLAFSNELRLDHSVTCPIITLRPQNDLPVVPVYTNIFAPPLPQPKRFVELGQAPARAGRGVAERPAGRDHRHRAPVPRARRPPPVRPARAGPGVRRQGRRVDRATATSRAACPRSRSTACMPRQRHSRVHGLHAHDGRRRRGRQSRLRRHLRPVPHAWRRTSPGTRTERRNEQVPGEQVPLHRRPRPGPRRALPRGPGRAPSPGGRPTAPNASSTVTRPSRAPGSPSTRPNAPRSPATTTRRSSTWAPTRSSR